ncbi:hypothetical protein AGABI1DRAFT_107436 [Agaricus bisporus var. burnettii JB137-S8]|uniref:Uncharacterized protein n=2 Tax=Agaricus bisporus var. burnettii TaxID=192524 RepID=K5XV67_AGABU|nr:uncharacterized protein AGABI1DRAFT_107436 [Agaricus bisporus var. burnettii JB137-S8]EKM79040.1 hypothetical protein AGABI1DRAFT_107436 [Agaricus bisporus var. burnettii JB137-S8]KAF7771724.1 hypothetical protein Agabi119p4_6035 [Agaricus bisporus var. burnettii]
MGLAAFWEPNPEWSLDGPRYLVTLHLPVNCASDDIAVAQFRRISHDEIRVSILNDHTSLQPTAKFNREEQTLTLSLRRLPGYRSSIG